MINMLKNISIAFFISMLTTGLIVNAFPTILVSYSLMNQAQVMSVKLWEKYLVYSISFGIAKTAMKDLKLNQPDADDQLNDLMLLSVDV